MFKINRTTEYGLIALQHMSQRRGAGDVISAREIADHYGLPFEITAKTLQRLKDTGLIQSAQGAKGGYTLQRALTEINLAEFLRLMEGPQAVVVCAGAEDIDTPHENADPNKCHNHCEYERKCEIKHVMNNLNARVYRFLSEITLAELAKTSTDPNRDAILASLSASLGAK
ncbi:MAG TPA: hypothetical protein DCS07_14865 [Bdellovibrionales bacterium]|nr:MAG: hypothetical protein A2Z97_08905 [Bdellovibrionales bacterium GWB1_52_6]OFZ04881.1 MAG: hypothetical protein A2X97_08875 [Bdellovibrionales bacterium GWA1_52_35]OFZ42327.1 MAG: hypothetical protein A2070_05595 [Bdellovibrionales bacterium GWC1_52_8]HAR43892.1 hypothetical protein [Bdellovibrionales bacterium]HCM38969.1 hypothetical protein [Bdellovibrionales bacterium]